MTATKQAAADTSPRVAQWATAGIVAAFVTLVVVLVVTGASAATTIPGLTDAGAVTRWGLPISKAALDGSAAVTVGLLGLAVVLAARSGDLDTEARHALLAASWTALVLALATVVVHLLTLSDLVGLPLVEALDGDFFATYITSDAQGQAYAVTLVIALIVYVSARVARARRTVVGLFVLALAALVPLAFVGHSTTGDYHHSARVSLLAHLIAMALWVGGLIALTWYAGRRGRQLPRVAKVFSALALGCFVTVAASGVLNAWLRVNTWSELFTTDYGLILIAKVSALGVLGVVGYIHRQRTLPLLEAGRSGAFRRLASGEVVVMAVAVGLAVALSRTEPPVDSANMSSPMPGMSHMPVESPVQAFLGFPIPAEISAARLFTDTYPDALFALGCLAAVALYLGGHLRLHQRGEHWPVGRTIAWLLGVAAVALVGLSGVMAYSMTMLSVHMVQHLTLLMVGPVLLVIGSPITLALRNAMHAPGDKPVADDGADASGVITAAVNSRVARFLTHPLVVLVLFTGSMAIYFTGMFEATMRNHSWHMLLSAQVLLAGFLFYEVLIGVDPLPRRPPFSGRVAMQLIVMVLYALFAAVLVTSTQMIASDFYSQLSTEITWLPDTRADQVLAGQLTWIFSGLCGLAVLGVLFVQWYRARDDVTSHTGSNEDQQSIVS